MGILCQHCKQAPATVHLTDIQQSGEPTERHLCEACAAQEGITMKVQESPQNMLEKFVKVGVSMQAGTQRKCPTCGITFGEFRAQGLLGCPHDYSEFGDLLIPLIERVQDGAEQHVGKTPGMPSEKSKLRVTIMGLRRELEAAVAAEQYEKAAKLRDELLRLEAEEANEY